MAASTEASTETSSRGAESTENQLEEPSPVVQGDDDSSALGLDAPPIAAPENGEDPTADSSGAVAPGSTALTTEDADAPSSDETLPDAPALTHDALILSTTPIPSPEVSGLLRITDLQEVAGFTRTLTARDLSGAPNTPSRGSIAYTHRRGFGASLEYRLYRNRVELIEDLGGLRESTPGSTAAPQIDGLRNAFLAEAFGVRSLTVATEPPLQLITLACSSDVCDETQLIELARRVLARLHGGS